MPLFFPSKLPLTAANRLFVYYKKIAIDHYALQAIDNRVASITYLTISATRITHLLGWENKRS